MVNTIGEAPKRALQGVARRDVEHRKPPPQRGAGDLRQAFLTAEVHDVQAAAVREGAQAVICASTGNCVNATESRVSLR